MIKLKNILFEGDMDVSSLNLHRTSVGFLDREKIIGYQWDNFQKNYLKLNPRYRIANANDRVYGYKLGEGDAHWMYDPNDGEIYLDDKMVARKVMTGRADKNIFEGGAKQDYQRIEIVYTEPGQGNRFYGTYAYLDGKKSHDTKFNEQETNDYLESMGVTIKVPRRHDSNILDSIVKKLQAKGVDAGHGDYMDVS